MSDASPSNQREGSQSRSSVVANVILQVDSPPAEFRIPARDITLTQNSREIQLGRSSKASDKGCTPAPDNGWFDSPVMSRHHATIRLDSRNSELQLMDTGSLHGTYVDHQRLTKDVPRTLHNGDRIRFGVQIDRGRDKFPPCHIVVAKINIVAKIDMKGSSFQPRKPEPVPGNYRVPDESDDEDSSDSDTSQCHDGQPQTQPFPGLKSILGHAQEKDAGGRGFGAKGLPKYVATVDLTDDSDSKPESPLEDDEVQEVTPESFKSGGATVATSKPSPGCSPTRSVGATEVVDLTSPVRDPSVDLAVAEDETEATIGQSIVPDERWSSFVGSPEPDVSDPGESSGWDASDCSEENDDATSCDDMSSMGEHDEIPSDDDDEIYDGDDREVNLPDGAILKQPSDWEDSMDGDSGSDLESDKDMDMADGPCSPYEIPQVAAPIFPSSRCLPSLHYMSLSGAGMEPRHPSPSDAVMPRKCHASAPFTGGEKSGKAEFWEAREVNKRRFCMGDREALTYQPHTNVQLPPMMNTREPTIHTPLASGPSHTAMPTTSFPQLGEFTGIGASEKPGTRENMDATSVHQWHNVNEMSFAPIIEPGNRMAENRRTHLNIKELVDGFESPQSNPEAAPRELSLRRAPSFAEMITSRCDGDNDEISQAMMVSLPCQVDSSRQPATADGAAPSTPGPKKRSIDEISKETPAEKAWAVEDIASKQPTPPLSHAAESAEETTLAEDVKSCEPSTEADSSAIPSPPKTPETRNRPNKRRRRRVVETMGIAAFGALSASFGIFAALVATAPDFQ